MELDDLKKVWEKDMNTAIEQDNFSFVSVKKKVSKIDFGIKFRDTLDVGGCIVAISALLYFLLSASDIGLFLLFVSLFLIVICLVYPFVVFRFRKNNVHNSWRLSARLDAEIEKLEKEQRFIFIADIFYGRPMMLGLLLFIVGMHHYKFGAYFPSGGYLVLLIACFIIYILAIIWLRNFWLKRKIKPMLEQLRLLRGELGEDNSI